jgi:hypothetical protein
VKLERAKIVVGCTADNLRSTRDAWVKLLTVQPMHALEWSRDGVRAVVGCEVYELALKALEAPDAGNGDQRVASLREGALRMVAQLASNPVFGPSVLDQSIHQFKLQAWQFLANDLATPGEDSSADGQ